MRPTDVEPGAMMTAHGRKRGDRTRSCALAAIAEAQQSTKERPPTTRGLRGPPALLQPTPCLTLSDVEPLGAVPARGRQHGDAKASRARSVRI